MSWQKELQPWIKSLRSPRAGVAVLLVLASFKVSHQYIPKEAWAVAFFVVVLCFAVMVWNDWRDRFHDIKKGKLLASSRHRAFLFYAALLWLGSITLALTLAFLNKFFAVIAITLIIGGLVYSELRKIFIVPTLAVAVISATPIFFALVSQSASSPDALWWLFIIVVAVIFAREVMKDLEDKNIDFGYKATLPLIIGDLNSRFLIGFLLIAVSWLVLLKFPKGVHSVFLTFIALGFLVAKNERVAKILLDWAILVFLCILLLV